MCTRHILNSLSAGGKFAHGHGDSDCVNEVSSNSDMRLESAPVEAKHQRPWPEI